MVIYLISEEKCSRNFLKLHFFQRLLFHLQGWRPLQHPPHGMSPYGASAARSLEHVEKFMELVSAKTNGDFKINISYGGLSKTVRIWTAFPLALLKWRNSAAGYHRDKNPTITVLELPFIGVANLEEEVAVAEAVYAHPAAQKDLARWSAKLFMTSPMPQYNVAGVGNAPKSLEDFNGMRIRATGGLEMRLKPLAQRQLLLRRQKLTPRLNPVVDSVFRSTCPFGVPHY